MTSKSAALTPSATGATGERFQHWALAGWALAGIAVAVIVAVSATPKARAPKTVAAKTVSKVLSATAVPVKADTIEAFEAVVEPKAVVAPAVTEPAKTRSAAEARSAEPEDYLTAFQRAVHVREKPVRDTHIKDTDARLIQAQLGPLKEALERSGKSVAEYLEDANLQVSDELLEALLDSTVPKVKRTSHSLYTDPEAMMLARDALQYVDPRMPREIAETMLRDIVAAQTEAARLGLSLPSSSDEQVHALNHWTSVGGRVGQLAETALSRLS